MVGILFGILAATCWGFSAVLVRFGLQYLRPTTGTWISLIPGVVLVMGLALVFNQDAFPELTVLAFVWFALERAVQLCPGPVVQHRQHRAGGSGPGHAAVQHRAPLRHHTGHCLPGRIHHSLASPGHCHDCRRHSPHYKRAGAMKAIQSRIRGGGRVWLGYAAAMGAALSYGASQTIGKHITTEYAPPLVGTAFALLFGFVYVSLMFHRHIPPDIKANPRIRLSVVQPVGDHVGVRRCAALLRSERGAGRRHIAGGGNQPTGLTGAGPPLPPTTGEDHGADRRLAPCWLCWAWLLSRSAGTFPEG